MDWGRIARFIPWLYGWPFMLALMMVTCLVPRFLTESVMWVLFMVVWVGSKYKIWLGNVCILCTRLIIHGYITKVVVMAVKKNSKSTEIPGFIFLLSYFVGFSRCVFFGRF